MVITIRFMCKCERKQKLISRYATSLCFVLTKTRTATNEHVQITCILYRALCLPGQGFKNCHFRKVVDFWVFEHIRIAYKDLSIVPEIKNIAWRTGRKTFCSVISMRTKTKWKCLLEWTSVGLQNHTISVTSLPVRLNFGSDIKMNTFSLLF